MLISAVLISSSLTPTPFANPCPLFRVILYFEAHQGCFTSESATKAHNRIMENKLHDAEFFITITNNMTSILRSEFDEIMESDADLANSMTSFPAHVFQEFIMKLKRNILN